MKRYFTPHTPGAVERIRQMTTSSSQLGYLDLEAFYQQAKHVREIGLNSLMLSCASVRDVCDKLMCVIDAIRADGLDPRWNPERDALAGMTIGSHLMLNPIDAETIITKLHQRGYKIVKDSQ